jgi:hypothetical protein
MGRGGGGSKVVAAEGRGAGVGFICLVKKISTTKM